MSKQKNSGPTPELRFQRDDGSQFPDWEIVPLKSVAKRQTTKNMDEKIDRVLTNSAAGGVLDQRDYFNKDIAVKSNLQGYYIVDEGDYVYNPRISSTAPVGPISKNKIGKGVMSPLYTILRFNNGNNEFYEQFFKSSKWHKYLRAVSNSGARHDRMSISTNNFILMPVPSIDEKEQQKIADCLLSMDAIIKSHIQKLEAFKNHKKGLLQKLFPEKGESIPKFRFPEFADTFAWNIKQFNKVFSRIKGKNKENNKNVLTISAQMGLVSQLDYFNKSVSARDVSGYYLLQKGDFAYNKSYSNGYPMGAIKPLNNYEKGVVSTLYICFRANNGNKVDFLGYYFDAGMHNSEIEQYAQEGARNHGLLNIGVDDFFNGTKLILPCEDEQAKIVDCLSSIDKLISVQSEKVKALKIHKQGLMQKLFSTMVDVN
jgi:type I restriction enzyme S subunit